MVGTANRFRVAYVDQGYPCEFTVHTLDEALFWAVLLRCRWSLSPWIDSERAPASQVV